VERDSRGFSPTFWCLAYKYYHKKLEVLKGRPILYGKARHAWKKQSDFKPRNFLYAQKNEYEIRLIPLLVNQNSARHHKDT